MEHPFPPERFIPEAWICPGLYGVAALLVLICAMRSKPASRAVIICLLAAVTLWFLLMLPRFQGAREAASRTQCRNNLHEIGLALHAWHEQHERLPEPVFHNGDGSEVSWRVRLPPYLAEPQLIKDYDESLHWDDAINLPVARREPMPYFCPTSPDRMDDHQRHFTAYLLLTGDGTAFPNAGPMSFDEISDGLGSTLLVGEACGARIVWTEPRDIAVAGEQAVGINLPGAQPGTSAGTMSSYHVGGVYGLFANGGARFISERTDPDVLRALLTADSGDRVGEF